MMTLQHTYYNVEDLASGNRKKEIILRQLKRTNPDRYELLELLKMHEEGRIIEIETYYRLMFNPYIQALFVIMGSEYPINANEIAEKCDISTNKVKHLSDPKHLNNSLGLIEVVRTDGRNRSSYKISEKGEEFLEYLFTVTPTIPDMDTYDEIQTPMDVIV